MVTYTEFYNKTLSGNYYGVKDISASRFHYLHKIKHCEVKKKHNRNKYNFMKAYKKSHYEYIVYNDDNF